MGVLGTPISENDLKAPSSKFRAFAIEQVDNELKLYLVSDFDTAKQALDHVKARREPFVTFGAVDDQGKELDYS